MAAFTLHTHLTEGANSFALALKLILEGDFSGALLALLSVLPIVGVWLIMYFLVYFAGVISIFKSKEHHKFAKMIALGVSFIGLLNEKIVGLASNLFAGSGLTLLLFILIVSLVLGMWMHARKSALKNVMGVDNAAADTGAAAKARRDSEPEHDEVRHEAQQQHHEEQIENQIENKEEDILDEAEKIIDEELKHEHTALELLDKMTHLLNEKKQSTSPEKDRKIGIEFENDLKKFENFVNLDYQSEEGIRKKIDSLKKFEFIGLRETKKAAAVAWSVRQTITEHIKKIISSNPDDQVWKDKVENSFIKVMDDGKNLSDRINVMNKDRIALESRVDLYLKQIENETRTKLVTFKNQLVAELAAGNNDAGIKVLHNLKLELASIDRANKTVADLLKRLKEYERDKNKAQHDFNKILDFVTSKKFDKNLVSGNCKKDAKKLDKLDKKVHSDSKIVKQDDKSARGADKSSMNNIK